MNIFDPQTQQPAQQDPASPWSGMTPQQKMAMVMMQNSQPKVDQHGAMSPMQGLSQVINQGLSGYAMRKPPQQPPMAPNWAGPDSGAGMLGTPTA